MKLTRNNFCQSIRNPENHYQGIIICLFIIFSTLSVYWQIQHHDFINFDDNEYITENIHVQQNITLKSVIWAFTEFHSNNWHPVTWLSHMLDVEILGVNPGRHHLVNLLFHIINSLLLFSVLRKMTGNLWKSGFVAALFALHPLHVESVAWASERKDVLSTFFWMLTLIGYIRYVQRKSLQRYLIVVLFFILGLLSKPMLVTLPFVLLLLDYWPFRRIQFEQQAIPWRDILKLILEKIPLSLLAATSAYITFLAQTEGRVVKSLDQFPIGIRLSNALVSYVTYIFKMIFPTKLAVLYPHPGMYPLWKITGALFILICISFFAVKSARKYPYICIGWFWYTGTMIPVIGLVQVGMQSMADRYTYIPFIGLFIVITWGLSDLMGKFQYRKFCIGFASLLVFPILLIITWKQIGYWKNSVTLYTHAINVTIQKLYSA